MDWNRENATRYIKTVSPPPPQQILDELKLAAQQAQAENWKLSKSDVQFLKAIRIKP